MRCRVREEQGSNAVEFALVLPILLTLVFGMFWGTIAYNRQLTLTQAAREGARFAATLPYTGSAPPDSWFGDVRARIADVSAGQLAADGSNGFICIRHIDSSGSPTQRSVGSGTCSPGSFPDNATGERVQVLVERPALIDIVFLSWEPVLSGVGVARYEVAE